MGFSAIKPGQNYLITTGTYTYLGTVISANAMEVVMQPCARIYDTGRFANFNRDGRSPQMEVEPYLPDQEVVIMRHSIQDCATWKHKLLLEQVEG